MAEALSKRLEFREATLDLKVSLGIERPNCEEYLVIPLDRVSHEYALESFLIWSHESCIEKNTVFTSDLAIFRTLLKFVDQLFVRRSRWRDLLVIYQSTRTDATLIIHVVNSVNIDLIIRLSFLFSLVGRGLFVIIRGGRAVIVRLLFLDLPEFLFFVIGAYLL